MADFKWDDYKPATEQSSFNWDDYQTDSEDQAGLDPIQTENLVEQILSAENIDTASDFADSAWRGGSFGLLDEFHGIAEAAGRAVGIQGLSKANPVVPVSTFAKIARGEITLGKPSLNILENYREARDKSREREKLAQERSPIISTVGNITGGMALPIGAAPTALKGLSAGQKIARASRFGGGMGAAYGFGTSEGDTVGEVIKDTAIGGATGTALGGGMSAGGQAIVGGVKGIAKLPSVEAFGGAYKRAARGEKVFGREAFNQLAVDFNNLAQKIGLGVKKIGVDLAEEQRNILGASDAKVNVMDMVRGVRSSARDLRKASHRGGLALREELEDAARLQELGDTLLNKDQVKGKITQLRSLRKVKDKMVDAIEDHKKAGLKRAENFNLATKRVDNAIIDNDKAISKAMDIIAESESPAKVAKARETLEKLQRRQNVLDLQKSNMMGQAKRAVKEYNDDLVRMRNQVSEAEKDLATGQTDFRNVLNNYKAKRQRLENLPVSEAYEQQKLIRDFQGLSRMGESRPLKTKAGSAAADKVRRQLLDDIYTSEAAKATSGRTLQLTNQKIKKFNDTLRGVGLEKISLEDFDDPKLIEYVTKDLQKMIAKLDDGNVTGIEMNRKLKAISDGLRELDPAFVDNIIPAIDNLAERYQLIGSTLTKDLIDGFSTGRQVVIGAGAALGALRRTIGDVGQEFARPIQQAAQGAQKASRAIRDQVAAQPEGTAKTVVFDNVGGFLRTPKGMNLRLEGENGRKLHNTLMQMANNPTRNSRAMQYMIMQNPAYRELLGMTKDDLTDGDSED